MLRSWLGQVSHILQKSRRRNWTFDHTVTVESLETRILLSATTADQDIIVQPHYEVTDAASPRTSSGPTGLSPAQIRQAYGFNSITFANGTIAGDGTGTTIAIVDAYDDPNIASDLHQFDLQFGLPDPVFTKVNQTGGTTLPKADVGWAGEIALDVEWAHAVAPGAKILLVEAKSSSLSDLMAAVDYARHASGVVAVSMSWGSSEFSGETSYDSYFTTPAGHPGVTFFVSSGDDGAPAEYPASSPNVVSVGGTTLNVSSNGSYLSESGWSGSGGGPSKYESQPSYQKGVVTQSTTARTGPDVAYDADPNTGVSVYDSYGNSSSAPWSQYGGTSAAAPQWAGLIAIADQGRALAGLGSLDGITQTLPKLYTLPAADFHDVTSGSSTGTTRYNAQAGYDLVTGRGSPIANLVVSGLVGSSSTTPPPPTTPVATHFVITAAASSTAGAGFSITVKALDASNNVVTGYRGTVHFTSSDVAGIIPGNYTFTTTDSGVHTFSSVTLKTAGSQNIKATDTASSSLTGTAIILVTPAAANHLIFSQTPTSTTLNSTISPAVTVQIVDAYNNVLTGDNLDTVTIAIGTNPSGAALSGTTSVKVVAGMATFNNLSLNQLGNGYTLVARSGTLSAATSGTFNVASASTVLEAFGYWSLDNYYYLGSRFSSVETTTTSAHDGSYGLYDYSGTDWVFRNDSTTQVKQGDTVSVWVKFVGAATGTAAFGFGATGNGTLSIVASASTNQLLLVNNAGYGAATIASSTETWQANHWYRLEVNWGATGSIVGKVYDSNGTTQLQSVSGTSTAITSGGIAFRTYGGTADWDTVQLSPGVNKLGVTSKSATIQNIATGPVTQVPTSSGVTTPGGIDSTTTDAVFGNLGDSSSTSTTDGNGSGDSGRTRHGHHAHRLSHHAQVQLASDSVLDEIFQDLF
ncbi:MAG: hypothetical protein JWN70_7118 [Planctomycetaceae bacterium]|nr:hypothetical protein [Planctomycetaceae bacterium]